KQPYHFFKDGFFANYYQKSNAYYPAEFVYACYVNKYIRPLKIKGLVINKYSSLLANSYKYIEIENQDSLIVLSMNKDMLKENIRIMWEQASIGDSVLKEQGSLEFYIMKPDK